MGIDYTITAFVGVKLHESVIFNIKEKKTIGCAHSAPKGAKFCPECGLNVKHAVGYYKEYKLKKKWHELIKQHLGEDIDGDEAFDWLHGGADIFDHLGISFRVSETAVMVTPSSSWATSSAISILSRKTVMVCLLTVCRSFKSTPCSIG